MSEENNINKENINTQSEESININETAKKKKKKKNVSFIKNKKLRSIAREFVYLRRKSGYYFKYMMRYKEINPKQIFFCCFAGRNYSCSPKAIYEQMLKDERFNDYEFIWAFKNVKKHRFLEDNPRTTVIKYYSKNYHKALVTSKYWISNALISEHVMKKNGQVFIQTWHGTPLKKIRCSIKVGEGTSMRTLKEFYEMNDNDAKRFDYLISPSHEASWRLREAFNLEKLFPDKDIIIETGYPRNDFLFKYNEEDVENMREELGIPIDKKVILYAPTYRDNQHTPGIGYTYEIDLDFEKMKEELSDEYVVIFRAHYFVASKFDFEKYNGFVIDGSKIDDINYIYIISDMLVTDYSSVFYDFANLKRPLLFYMYDLEEYKNDLRDFYTDFDFLPGPMCKTTASVIEEIKNIDTYFDRFGEKYKQLNDTYNNLDDGNCSKKVIDTCIKFD